MAMDNIPHRLDIDIPDPVESRRTSSGRLVRIVYAIGIISLAVFLAWHFGKQLFMLEGPGIVTAKRYVISAPYTAQVVRMNIDPGEDVKIGDDIALVSSFEVEKYISDLLNLVVDQTTEETALRVKVAVSLSTHESTMKRLSAANDSVLRFENALNRDAASLQYRSDIYREQAVAMLSVAQSNAEGAESAAQLSKLSENMGLIERQMSRINDKYRDGHILAPISGVISSRIAESGETIPAGGIIAEIFDTGDIYIDWTVPALRLIQPRVGDAVLISDGSNTFPGTISQLFSVSADFAGGNKSAMSETKSGQIARVRADNLRKLVILNTNVSLRMSYLPSISDIIKHLTP